MAKAAWEIDFQQDVKSANAFWKGWVIFMAIAKLYRFLC